MRWQARDVTDIAVDAPRPPEGDRLLEELIAINDEVDASALDMERLAQLATLPENTVLSAARLRFSRALRRHLLHAGGAVLPHLRNTRASPAVDDFQRLLHEYHEAAAHHVARWPSTSVATDWHGYRKSVGEMLARLRMRAEIERRTIHPLLVTPETRPR